MADIICIRTADGDMHALFDIEFRGRKNLVLSAAADRQDSIEIVFYRGESELASHLEQIGSFGLENISGMSQGGTEVALIVGIDDDGLLHATAYNKENDIRNQIAIALHPTEDEPSLHDFEGDAAIIPPAEKPVPKPPPKPVLEYEERTSEPERKVPRKTRRRRRRRFLVLFGYLLLLIAVLAALTYLIFNALQDANLPQP